MGRGAWILIAAIVALGIAALTAKAMITLLQGYEYLEFAIVIVLFLVVLLGSYWFLFAPASRARSGITSRDYPSSPSHRGRDLCSGLRPFSNPAAVRS